MIASNTSCPDPRKLAELREFFAAGFFELPQASPMRRLSRAVRRRFENRGPTAYKGEGLYPVGNRAKSIDAPESQIVVSFSSRTWSWDANAFHKVYDSASESQRETLDALQVAMDKEHKLLDVIHTPHTIGGAGFTHSIPNYDRVILEGLDEHARRIADGLIKAQQEGDQERIDFYSSLEDVMEGIRAWHVQLLDYLCGWESDDPQACENRDRLVQALQQVPFKPARTFLEAMVAYNFTFYLDDCDDPGRMDRVLAPFYEKDIAEGRITRDQAWSLMRQFVDNSCDNGSWSAAIGGSNEDGSPYYNELTKLCIEASHHRFRPSWELCVREDMPDDVWDTALEGIATGSGQPAFYNEQAYLNSLRRLDLGISEDDLVIWNGGGCTETMIHGRSNVGSLDAGLNILLILEETLGKTLCNDDVTFDDILKTFRADLTNVVEDVTNQISLFQQARAKHRPQPMRTLLIEDCIDCGKEFNNGGARYYWSVVNVAGLANVADSLAAIQTILFDQKQLTPSELLTILKENFKDNEPLRQHLLSCPKFGNDQPEVDQLGAEIGTFVYQELLNRKPWLGGVFMPSCIMFQTYAAAGSQVGATPDGRLAHAPLSDSIGPVQGRDTHGPTAMLKSCAAIPQHLALGTPVLNLRFSKATLACTEGRQHVRSLIQTYFDMGGLQVQVSVVDRKELEDALLHPERHENLIVRIGGYATFFNWLDDDLKQAVIERTEYAV